MSVDLRMPNINGSEREQLVQIRSYLYQLIPQLQWALDNVNVTNISSEAVERIAQQIGSSTASGTDSASIDVASTFAQLKPLIIKSADIVEAYYEEINKKLEGLYIAESDFGTFAEKTTQDIQATSAYVEQKFNDIQVIISDEIREIDGSVKTIEGNVEVIDGYVKEVEGRVEDVSDSVMIVDGRIDDVTGLVGEVENSIKETNERVDTTNGAVDNLKVSVSDTSDKVSNLNSAIEDVNKDISELKVAVIEANAYIRSGLLYYDDAIPMYGLEIGQRTEKNGVEVFNKYARFVSNKLSFYDSNDYETAYISDKKLYINNVEINFLFKMGGFEDTVQPDKSIVTKWIL